jgi:hypothetical protein
MSSFEPDRIQVPCGHFIGGRVLPAPERFTVSRPSDGKPHAGLPGWVLIDFSAASDTNSALGE